MRELEQYMAFRDVNSSVRERVKRFLVEKYPEKRVYDERQILGALPIGTPLIFRPVLLALLLAVCSLWLIPAYFLLTIGSLLQA